LQGVPGRRPSRGLRRSRAEERGATSATKSDPTGRLSRAKPTLSFSRARLTLHSRRGASERPLPSSRTLRRLGTIGSGIGSADPTRKNERRLVPTTRTRDRSPRAVSAPSLDVLWRSPRRTGPGPPFGATASSRGASLARRGCDGHGGAPGARRRLGADATGALREGSSRTVPEGSGATRGRRETARGRRSQRGKRLDVMRSGTTSTPTDS
jgi:hypothetical protein